MNCGRTFGLRKMIAKFTAIALAASACITVLPQTATEVYAANPVKALQLVSNNTAANISGAQVSSVYFGNYKQSSDENGGYNTDPIKWRVLSNANGKLLLLSDKILDYVTYEENNLSAKWDDCTLRRWLNGETSGTYANSNFIDSAFAGKEKTAIAETNVVAEANPEYPDVPYGSDTQDRLFLLSIQEGMNPSYGFTGSNLGTATRQAVLTAYSAGLSAIYNEGEPCFWWLRSPGYGGEVNQRAAHVNQYGYLNQQGGEVRDDPSGVRPAFNLNLGSVLFTSAAEGGKDPGTGSAGTLNSIAAYSGSEWKLTVSDSSRSGFTAAAATGATLSKEVGYTSWTVPVTYSYANTGENEHVSAILTDSSGAALYYGYLAANSASGTQDVTIPTGLSTGTYTLNVFNEEVNGDKKTDYSSPIRTITLNVTAPTYAVTVQANSDAYGTVSSNKARAAAGTTVSVSAIAKTGYVFDHWSATPSVSFVDVNNKSTTFTMPSEAVTVTANFTNDTIISYDVTFKVKNGSWDDGSKDDKTVNLWRYDNEDLALILTAGDIPAVGNEPDNGFTAGSWDTDPRNQTITSNRTFTYTYIKSRGIIQDHAAVLGNNVNTENAPTVMYGVCGGNPCSWRVIGYDIYGNDHAKKSGAMTLFASDYIGGKTRFSTNSNSNYSDYGQSDVLKPFINDIYNGFNDKEKPAIINRDLSDIPTHLENTDAQPLWPLSVDEANALPSADFRKTSGEYNHWWLRTQGTGSDVHGINYVADVNGSTGEVQSYGNNPIANYLFRARPAFYLDLQEILFISAPTKAGGGKASNTVGKGALKEVASYTGTSWKLTLKDDGTGIAAMNGHAGFSAALTNSTVPVKAGEDISVDYSGAVASASGNEYVSAMLCDSDGKDVLYYGRLKQIENDTDTSGTLHVTIPASVPAGDYKLKIFSEQYNGDNITDLAGTMVPIDITVEAGPAPHTHKWTGTVTKAPTLFAEGVRTYTCSGCEETYTESISKLEPATETQKELAEQMEEILQELTGDDGELTVDVDIKTEEKEDGTTETVVEIGGQEVIRIVTDSEGNETIESSIWSLDISDEEYIYTGAPIKPGVRVYDGLTKLEEGSEYTLKYSNNTNAGNKAQVTVDFKGGYSGTTAHKKNFTIEQASLSENVLIRDILIASNGRVQKPVPEVIMKATDKTASGSFNCEYRDEDGNIVNGVKDPGNYTVTLTPGKKNKNFKESGSAEIIVKGDKKTLMSGASVTFNPAKYTYTGQEIIPAAGTYTLKLNGTVLTEGQDYRVSEIRNNIKPGKATMVFTAVDDNEAGYVGSKKATFEITNGREIEEEKVSAAVFTYEYEKTVHYAKGGAKPSVTVKDGNTLLTEGTDYTLEYINNRKVTTEDKPAAITVKGKGKYKGKAHLKYAIVAQDINTLSANIIVEDKAQSKNGYMNPAITIKDLDGKTLSKNKDFVIGTDYTDPDEKGVVTVSVSGTGNYKGTTKVSYRYLAAKAMLNKAGSVKIAGKIYTGRQIKLTNKELSKLLYTGKLKDGNYLKPGEDFVVESYSNNVKTGTAKVTLRGIGSWGGRKTVSFKINAKKKSLIKLIFGKNRF